MRGGFLRGDGGELMTTSVVEGATMQNGFLRAPDGALVVSGDGDGGGGFDPGLLAHMKGVVVHGDDPNVPRPTDGFGSYEWIGSVEPNFAADGDTLSLVRAA